MAVIAGLTLTTGINTDTSGSMLAILFMTVLAGIFIEELMFRGLVFHWFREVSVRKQILISGFGFGSGILTCNMTDTPVTITLGGKAAAVAL